tara:strand:+ start:480 stop:1355 length:876 start_codon:yes stop_codon:yes gene_type:complete
MLEKFTAKQIKTSGAKINVKIAGDGPPVLFLHGYPQTHMIWHKVAPELSNHYTVVLTDLRGYGDSSKPKSDIDHTVYSKREMAFDQVEVMQNLGFKKFSVVGHDRGARVAHRMLIDYKQSVKKAVVMDIVPTLTMYEETDRDFAYNYYHWFFLTQPFDLPEKMIGSDPKYYLQKKIKSWGRKKDFITQEAFKEYLRCFSNPKTIHASCEDYRASNSIDLLHDKYDYGTKTDIPLLVLWGRDAFVGSHYNVLEVWKKYANNVKGKSLPGGHYIPEEAPKETIKSIMNFLNEK